MTRSASQIARVFPVHYVTVLQVSGEYGFVTVSGEWHGGFAEENDAVAAALLLAPVGTQVISISELTNAE